MKHWFKWFELASWLAVLTGHHSFSVTHYGAFKVQAFLACGWQRDGRALKTLVFFAHRCRTLREEVLMYVGRFGGWLLFVAILPVFVALKVAQVDGVPDECWLDQAVDIGLHRHSRTRVDFDQPWFHLVIQHYVKAQDFKTTLQVWNQGAKIDGCEDNDLLHTSPHHVVIISLAVKVWLKLSKWPFQAWTLPILYISGSVLVDGAICQVGEDVLQVSSVVPFGRETDDSFLK